MSVVGGYVHFNPHGNRGIANVLTGTTMDWFLLSGWESKYLYRQADASQMRPIKLGMNSLDYQLQAGSKRELLQFLRDRGRQEIGKAKNDLSQDPANLVFMYTGTGAVPTETAGTHVTAHLCKAEKPPSTIIREGLLEIGGGFIGLGGCEVIEAATLIHDLGGFVQEVLEAAGVPGAEKLTLSSGSEPKTLLSISLGMGGHHDPAQLCQVPLGAARVTFTQLADALEGLEEDTLSPAEVKHKKGARAAMQNVGRKARRGLKVANNWMVQSMAPGFR